MNINIIVAYCKNRGIGLNNQLPWHIPSDLKRFAKITKGSGKNAIIMGRKTYESIGRVLPDRHNIVLSKSVKFDNVDTYDNIEDAIKFCEKNQFEEVFVIGGAQIYEEVLNKKLIHKVYATIINKDFECDTFFPFIPDWYTTEFIVDKKDKNIFYKTFTYKS